MRTSLHPHSTNLSHLEPVSTSFYPTHAYDRFAMLCHTCETYGYVAICVGSSGCGKTRAAQEYTQWPLLEPFLARPLPVSQLPATLRNCHALLHTGSPMYSPRLFMQRLDWLELVLDRLHGFPLQDQDLALVKSRTSTSRTRHINQWQRASDLRQPRSQRMGRHAHATRLVLVDDADELPPEALFSLLTWCERVQAGLIFLGGQRLAWHARRLPLRRRIDYFHRYGDWYRSDLYQITCRMLLALSSVPQQSLVPSNYHSTLGTPAIGVSTGASTDSIIIVPPISEAVRSLAHHRLEHSQIRLSPTLQRAAQALVDVSLGNLFRVQAYLQHCHSTLGWGNISQLTAPLVRQVATACAPVYENV